MHSCLNIHEILDLILSNLVENRTVPQAKDDLLSVALTCHDFLESALDVLWKTQTSLVPLIKTLPQNCWQELTPKDKSEGGTFRRFDLIFELLVDALTIEEQTRFAYYAGRIRQLKYSPYVWHDTPKYGSAYDLMIIRVLWKTRTNKEVPLFSKLQHLEFVKIDHAKPCLDIFLETKQVSLSLYWSHTNDSMTSVIPIIEKHALNMEELDLGSFQDVERYSGGYSPLSRLVCKMKDLRGLSCGPHTLDVNAIEHLSTLPRLRKLHLPHDSREILQGLNRRELGTQNAPPFPELQDLFIRETNLSSFKLLTQQMRPLHIQDLTLQLNNTFNAQDIKQSFAALAQDSSQQGNVRRVSYKQKISSRRPSLETLSVDKRVVVGESILEPLLTLTNLTVLELNIFYTFDLGDSEMKLMADAWPRLKHLRLGSLLGWRIPSCITYEGFLHLLLKCPELEYLAFVFDASSNIPNTNIITAGHINKNITYLYIGNSRIGTNDCVAVGKFLGTVLPNCCAFGGDWMVQGQSPLRENERDWMAVQNAMKKQQLSGVTTKH